MATELIATAAGAATSSDIIVADGSTATVFLKDADGGQVPVGSKVAIEIKDSASGYNTIGWLTDTTPIYVIAGAGTYRLRRYPTGAIVGAEQG